jgi:hypothetical protein
MEAINLKKKKIMEAISVGQRERRQVKLKKLMNRLRLNQ